MRHLGHCRLDSTHIRTHFTLFSRLFALFRCYPEGPIFRMGTVIGGDSE